MKALKGYVPRAYADHRRVEAKRYAEIVAALLDRLGALPKGARPLVREYGRVAIMLDNLNREHDHAMERRRIRDARRLRRELKVNRFLLLKLENHLQHLAGARQETSDPIEALMREDVG